MPADPPAPLPLAVNELGAGPPMIVLHGLLGRARNWLTVARSLDGRYAMTLADLRNHGASPWSPEMDYPALAADVAALIAARGGRATLLGHSMGGKTALALALTRPELVERLILVDIAPVTYADHNATYIKALLGVDLAAIGKRADAEAALRPAVPDPAMRGFLLQNLEPRPGEGFAWQPNLPALLAAMPQLTAFPQDLLARRWEGPAFCIRGARSDYVQPEGEAALRRVLPQIEILTMPDAGHWPHSERPAEFLAMLERCL
ncbi:MAG: alpha/beta fold hydrolase [Geminicoccaceae bacterium]